MTSRTIAVGRKNRSFADDVNLSTNEDSVGKRHLEISCEEDGSFLLLDLNSANGTFIRRDGRWDRIEKSQASASTRIRLGEYETTVSDLISLCPPADSCIPPPLPKGDARPRRNPATGEIEYT